MNNFADITINDGAGTPVAHTFTAKRIDNGIAKWQDVSGGIAAGFPTITAQLRDPIKGQAVPVYKGQLKIVVPLLETISNSTYSGILPAPKKACEVTANLDVMIPERVDAAMRANIVAYVANALANGSIKAIFKDLTPVV